MGTPAATRARVEAFIRVERSDPSLVVMRREMRIEEVRG